MTSTELAGWAAFLAERQTARLDLAYHEGDAQRGLMAAFGVAAP